jgi:sensor domain CHASE-containing protein
MMPIERLIFFAGWLTLALLGGVLVVFVWEWLRSRYSAREGKQRIQLPK